MTILKDFTDKKGNYDILWKHVARRKNKPLRKQLTKPLRTVIDIGAWWGPWTLWWQPHAKKVEVFEPNPHILPMLENNIKELPNCTLHKTALGDVAGTVNMEYQSHSGTNHITEFNGTIPLKTLDSYNFQDVDIIKIDVEGFETAVLEGAEQTIKTQKPIIQVEGNSSGKRYGIHKQDIFNILTSWGMIRIEKKWPDQVWTFI